MTDNVLQGLAQSNISNQVRVARVLQTWLEMNGQDGGVPVTWMAILDVIRGPLVNNKALAMRIYEYLKQQNGKCVCNYFIIILILEEPLNYKSILFGA